MAGELTLRVITPDRIALDARVESVRLPAVGGSLGILPRHAPMVAALEIGELFYVEKGVRKAMFVSEGFAEVRSNTVRVVCEAGESPEEIDEARAREAEKRARERIEKRDKTLSEGEVFDLPRAEAALRRALTRLSVHSSKAGRERVRS
ncbi:MAG TPA: ATP synthase F1 subunit epsilon [Planctomycetota bacterium]|nr:ATP synthase F1 subunit epsilon [Planctomycetota bacterium]